MLLLRDLITFLLPTERYVLFLLTFRFMAIFQRDRWQFQGGAVAGIAEFQRGEGLLCCSATEYHKSDA